ncbi:MAG: outer membrane beta-barrel protein [Gemmatimonadota bacterium]|nr:outer membrane beta-barrel protein [Gemmatimonadota bacterium]
MRVRSRAAAAGGVLAAMLSAGGPPAVAGQGIYVGPQATSSEHANWGFGPRLMIDLGPLDLGFRLQGSFDYFFPSDSEFERAGIPVMAEDVDYWELNLNVHWVFGIPLVAPYIGGGLNIAHTKVEGASDSQLDVDETDTGVNVLGGVELKIFGFAPFLEARKEFGGGDQWMVALGFTFR